MTAYTVSETGAGADGSVDEHNAGSFNPGDSLTLIGPILSTIIPPSSGLVGAYEGDESLYIKYQAGAGAMIVGDAVLEHFTITAKSFLIIQDLIFDGADAVNKGIAGRTECKNLIVRRCGFANYQKQAIQLSAITGGGAYGQDISFEDLDFTDIGVWGDSDCADINITTYHRRVTCLRTKHYAVRANRGVDGITYSQDTADGTGHLIDGSEFYGPYQEQYTDFKGVKPGASGETKSIVRNCIMDGQGTDSVCSHLHFNSAYIDYVNNTVRDCGSFLHFIAVGSGSDAMGYINVIANKISNLTNSLYIEGGDVGDLLGNNVFAQNTCKNIQTVSTSKYSIDVRTPGKFINNDFINMTAAKTPHQVFRFQEVSPDPYAGSTVENNYYNHPDGSTGLEKLVIKYNPGPYSRTLSQLRDDGKELFGKQIDSLYDIDTNYPDGSPVESAGLAFGVWWTGDIPTALNGVTYKANHPDVGAYQHMATTYPEQILAAITTLLTGLTTTGANVQRDQVDPVADVPAISVELGSDEIIEGSDANMAYMDSQLNVQIVVYVKNSAGLSTELNLIRKEAHIAIYSDRTLGLSFVLDTMYTDASEISKSGTLEKESAQQTFNYIVHYRHSISDPSD